MGRVTTDIDRIQRRWEGTLESAPTVHEHELPFVPTLIQLARQASDVLEVGAGMGRMLNVLADSAPNARLVGVDLNPIPASIRYARVTGDARRLPFRDRSFDLVYSLGVVEHWPQTAASVAEHSRVTRAGGHVLVTTPHRSIFTVVRWASYLAHREWRLGSFQVVRGRNLTVRAFQRVFTQSGLTPVWWGTSGVYPPRVRRWFTSTTSGAILPETAYLWILGRREPARALQPPPSAGARGDHVRGS